MTFVWLYSAVEKKYYLKKSQVVKSYLSQQVNPNPNPKPNLSQQVKKAS